MGKIVTMKYRANRFKTERWLKKNLDIDLKTYARDAGQRGVEALMNATPVRTGLTASSWRYKIEEDKDKGSLTLIWTNSNIVDDWFNVALMLQYGHGTKSGVWVEGIDYINPALKDIFDDIANNLWREVTK